MTPTRMLAEEGPSAAIRRLLAELMERDVIDAVLVQMAQPRSKHLSHALISDIKLLAQAQPLAPSMPVNAARLASKLSIREPGQRIAVVLRPCEERSLVELIKLKQASLEQLYPIVFDCPGACPQGELERLASGPDGLEGAAAVLLASAHEPAAPGLQLRGGCQLCTRFTPGRKAEVALELFGHPSWIGVRLSKRLEQAVDLVALGLEPKSDDEERDTVVDSLRRERQRALDDALERSAAMTTDVGALLESIAGCVRCGNCQRVCPICFCRRCTFEMPHFDHEPDFFLRRAGRIGATRMPEDVTLYHLTRLAHVALSCSACGTCEEACPQGIELTRLFAHAARHVRPPFDYTPGRDVEEPLPLATFEAEELEPR